MKTCSEMILRIIFSLQKNFPPRQPWWCWKSKMKPFYGSPDTVKQRIFFYNRSTVEPCYNVNRYNGHSIYRLGGVILILDLIQTSTIAIGLIVSILILQSKWRELYSNDYVFFHGFFLSNWSSKIVFYQTAPSWNERPSNFQTVNSAKPQGHGNLIR